MKFLRKLMGGGAKSSPPAITRGTASGADEASIRPFDEVTAVKALLNRSDQADEAPDTGSEDAAASQARKDALAAARAEIEAEAAEAASGQPKAEQGGKKAAEVMAVVADTLKEDPPASAAPASIWDLDEDDTPADAAPVRATGRKRRTKTRLVGFDKSDGDVVDLFEEKTTVAPTLRAQFPVGWILVTKGPGRGECFALQSGMSQIGRGEDQAIQLDFGDSAISRSNHAAIVYDPQGKKFLLGHGGKANIVRLNDKPVISNEDLDDGDHINIGETTLRLVTLCGEDFDWGDEDDGEENEDVAIA